MITRPLELESRTSRPPRDLDAVAWVNVSAIALFFAIFGSPFVLAPGLPVGIGGDAGSLVVPTVGPTVAGAGVASVVVSYRADDKILFEGGMYTLHELRKHVAVYARDHPGAVMLVRADRQVSMQAFIDLCEMARAVGFANVLVAGEPGVASPSGR
ncbi:MAG: biopolymer transporter ExbD [Opitutaceae bacterium]|nr:biopolymer transporter ExbD [Opitutaceae bacterium]